MKSTVEQIRERFDKDVERFSNLETGQTAAMDSPLMLDLISRAAAALNRGATSILDIGCGAGNYTLKLLDALPSIREAALIDLSLPMLERAKARTAGRARVETIQGDVREVALGEERFDLAVAAAVMHHLRTDEEWRAVFGAVYTSLKPGGSFWIADMVEHSIPRVHELMWDRYGAYLAGLRDEAYRQTVFAYIDAEDTPKPLVFQLDMLREAGFRQVDVLHKNGCFAAFGGQK
ncbi:MAG: class I SAM-dependent methyltransferase [Bryobacterales bacterium]|nr:class I SAM-dependent methyltransferase [Bryobacterales bacterium]